MLFLPEGLPPVHPRVVLIHEERHALLSHRHIHLLLGPAARRLGEERHQCIEGQKRPLCRQYLQHTPGDGRMHMEGAQCRTDFRGSHLEFFDRDCPALLALQEEHTALLRICREQVELVDRMLSLLPFGAQDLLAELPEVRPQFFKKCLDLPAQALVHRHCCLLAAEMHCAPQIAAPAL